MAEARGLIVGPPVISHKRAENASDDELFSIYFGMNENDVDTLHIISVCLSSISFMATSLSLYWLVRMRRSFRHDLIALLITSDFAKSLSYMVYDFVSINDGVLLQTGTTFCEVSGFFFSMGLEAADGAVFLIAVHSMVYIFGSNRAGGDTGLYPYRHWAYAFFVIWPVLMASLAFVKGDRAYVDTGRSCYLPKTPWWYRTTLSWIPRYAIMLLILVMYTSSYIYIRVLIRRYSSQNSEHARGRPQRTAPATPPLISHGLLPDFSDSPRPRRSSWHGASVAAAHRALTPPRLDDETMARDSFRIKFARLYPGARIKGDWAWGGFNPDASATPGLSSASVSPRGFPRATGLTGTSTVEQVVRSNEPDKRLRMPRMALFKRKVLTETTSSTRTTATRGRTPPGFFRRPLSSVSGPVDRRASRRLSRARSRAPTGDYSLHIRTMLRQGQSCPTAGDTSLSSSPVVALDTEAFESVGISRSRNRIRRQLRFLFIYPVVYACVWIVPFINDVSNFQARLDGHNPYWLLVCSLISLSMQGLADTMVFCTREQPWRHLRRSFRESLGLDFVMCRGTLRKDSGRTREEMVNDSVRARFRREEEREREHELRRSAATRQMMETRNWWDVESEWGTVDDEDDESPEEESSGGHDDGASRAVEGNPRSKSW